MPFLLPRSSTEQFRSHAGQHRVSLPWSSVQEARVITLARCGPTQECWTAARSATMHRDRAHEQRSMASRAITPKAMMPWLEEGIHFWMPYVAQATET